MPAAFRYPDDAADFWEPFAVGPSSGTDSGRGHVLLAHLRSGVSVREAQRDLDSAAAEWARPRGGVAGFQLLVQSLRDTAFGWTKQPLVTALIVSGLLLV